jgi:hypothetical protein
MSKILYNQLFEKIGVPYENGEVPRASIINTKWKFFKNIQDNLKHDCIVAMAMGDNGLHNLKTEYFIGSYCIPHSTFKSFNPHIKKLYCTHASVDLPFVEGIPAGLMFSDNSNIDLLELAENINVKKEKLLLVKYNKTTHPLRPGFLDYYSQFKWATCEEHDSNFDIGYFLKMKSHKFTLCPRGMGPDSYRVWEALHMGSIPIVQSKNTYGCHHYFDLPILQIDNLGTLTEEFLEQKYIEMQKDYNWSQLIEEYWIQKIESNIC